jgi:hypothetical protein
MLQVQYMIFVKILTSLDKRLCSDLHPLYRWSSELLENGISIQTYYDCNDKRLKGADALIIHSRYLKKKFPVREELINCLVTLKRSVNKLIWFDATDSSGTSDFDLIPYVDVFLKKQVLKDINGYTGQNGTTNLRVWLDPDSSQIQFTPCSKDMLNKIKVGWNLAYFDYRNYSSRLKLLLSNVLGYWFRPIAFSEVGQKRLLDLTFRGTVKYDDENHISFQRNKVLTMLSDWKFKMAFGETVPRAIYLKELATSKVSISPFGWGEICYRDFETFICGSLLIKPSMSHVHTFPNLFIENETFIPVHWFLDDLPEKIETVISNYKDYKHIAVQGQEEYRRVISDPQGFIEHFKQII